MWKEILRFELVYRMKRPETYFFFAILFGLSIFGVDFIFQGVEVGQMKLNAPIVVGKTMGAISGIFMILVSIIMGVPILRDDNYLITPIMYTQPIEKTDFLLGRFLGSFLILVLIYLALPLGMMVGEMMPWHLELEMLPFATTTYLSNFIRIVLPTLFFGSALFFVTGTLSRKMLVVYTQGIIVFVLFLLTKAIKNEYLQAILDPFSLTTITQISKDWTIDERNSLLLPFDNELLVNKVFWISIGLLALWYGFRKFSFSLKSAPKSKASPKALSKPKLSHLRLPSITPEYGPGSHIRQFYALSTFYLRSFLKETSFWAILICGAIIILVNSINLGTVYGVDSYPTTYFIVEELQEMAMYFFVIILLFYSGELYMKERAINLHVMTDASPVSSIIVIASKLAALIGIYVILIASLILSGLVFQASKGYYHFDLDVYFLGFFVEILPFLVVFTVAAFFIQSLVNNKFLGILISLVFLIIVMVLDAVGCNHTLLYFGGGGLSTYSEMNGYGSSMTPYLWTKLYWLLICALLIILAALLSTRGQASSLLQRVLKVRSRISSETRIAILLLFLLVITTGAHNYYKSNVLHKKWSHAEKQEFRSEYEKQLKQYEGIPQLSIVETNLLMEIYPREEAYELEGSYILKNEEPTAISEIHIQKQIEDNITLENIEFSCKVSIDSQHHLFGYTIFHLDKAIEPGDSLSMHFSQYSRPKGYDAEGSSTSVLENGSFIDNGEFPSLGYERKYELRDSTHRLQQGLRPRKGKAGMDDQKQLKLARGGSDSQGLMTSITLGTSNEQKAITSGNLVRTWTEKGRSYYHYVSNEPIINFYCILSGRYEVLKDQWTLHDPKDRQVVDLEIYHHPRHTYNLDRMMDGMKASLSYYSSEFSPYQYQQLRIVEFPRYEQFAQSFPSTIPFSESIGFMLDINDSSNVDMTFFVTAHEVAHQWWGMQLETANVLGRNFVLETLAQYSALMVFKHRFPKEKVDELLSTQMEKYREGLKKAKEEEVALNEVGNEDYIYYYKGINTMHQLSELIGEENLNKALRLFLLDWNSKNGRIKKTTRRYATSEDLVSYILSQTPLDHKQEVAYMLTVVN